MHRRHQHTNIPTELVRTLVVIDETRSFSKAGDKLGLSQPAISAQVKRLQILTGGPVFQKSGHGGLELTPRGRMVLAHARKLLEANDQILSLAGSAGDVTATRLGVAVTYIDAFLSAWKEANMPLPLHYYCDGSAQISKSLSDGFLDIGCLLDSGRQIENFATAWEEELVWVRSPDFVLSPGAPIPLVSWPGASIDVLTINALERAGVPYRVVFASVDYHSRLAAVSAGIGIMGLLRRSVSEPFVIASEYYLPKIDAVRAGIVIRPGFNPSEASALIDTLGLLSPKSESTDVIQKSQR